MELVRMSDLYAVRAAILSGRVSNMSLAQIDKVIEHSVFHEFITYDMSAKEDEALNAIDGKANRGGRALH